MDKVLVTGAGGFIGRSTIRYLLECGYEVHAVSSKKIGENRPKLYYHDVDLLDAEQAERLIKTVKPSYLLHFAWYVEHGKFWDAEENHDWVRASLGLLKAFAANGGRRVVMAGTCFEYDGHTDAESFSEISSPLAPESLYAKSKNDLHMMAQEFCEEHDVSFAWGRIFFVFGLFESPNRFIPAVIRSLLMGQEAKCSHGNQIRDFMFVDDVGEGFVKLLGSNVQGPVNVASGNPLRLKEIAAMIAEIIGKPELLRLGALPSNPNEPVSVVADVTRLQSEVGFYPPNELRIRLEKTINWWKTVLSPSERQ